MAFAYLIPYLGNSVLQIAVSLVGWVLGPIVGVIILGIYVPFAEAWVRQ